MPSNENKPGMLLTPPSLSQLDEAQVIDIVQRAVDDGRLPLLRTDVQNDPVSEDLETVEDVYLRSGKRLYFDNVLTTNE